MEPVPRRRASRTRDLDEETTATRRRRAERAGRRAEQPAVPLRGRRQPVLGSSPTAPSRSPRSRGTAHAAGRPPSRSRPVRSPPSRSRPARSPAVRSRRRRAAAAADTAPRMTCRRSRTTGARRPATSPRKCRRPSTTPRPSSTWPRAGPAGPPARAGPPSAARPARTRWTGRTGPGCGVRPSDADGRAAGRLRRRAPAHRRLRRVRPARPGRARGGARADRPDGAGRSCSGSPRACSSRARAARASRSPASCARCSSPASGRTSPPWSWSTPPRASRPAGRTRCC